MILYFQSPETINNISDHITHYTKHSMFGFDKDKHNKILNRRTVKLQAFALLPNHFHLLVEEIEDRGISKYMQRISNSYTKYFNTKYKGSGHLFQNRFQSVRIKDNDQLLYASTYIHRNCRDNPKWINKEKSYPWSSYQDYIDTNRWNNLLDTELILSQFADQKEYENEVKTSSAKIKELEIVLPFQN
ncbi:MAG: transposase [Candidatus Vogelbacteria bacterium]|nr:transposase [Candidatus Vogelbacteria bacterium]